MKPLQMIAACVVSVAVLGACSDEGSEVAPPAAVEERAADDEAEATPSASEATEPTTEEVTQLAGIVGTPDDPDAFEITLQSADGGTVDELPAGEYVIDVNDLSDIHNWHLTGPGGVDVQTSVGEVTSETFEVTLEPGEYTYVCDPHPRMVGTFQVV